MSSLFVVDGMKRSAFPVKIDVGSSTVADLFREVAKSYKLELDPLKNLRIIFVDKELKYTHKTKLRKVDIVNGSTIAVIFRLPDRHPTAPATTEDADVVESAEVKIDEENKDAEEVSITESVPVKLDVENKDTQEVSISESVLVKIDEENKDAEEVSISESVLVKIDEENKDAEEVSITESVPDERDEESKDAKDVSDAESIPVKTKKKTKKKKQKDATFVPLLENAFDSMVVTTDKENEEAGDILVAESEPVKGKKKRKRNKRKARNAVPVLVEKDEERPVLQHLPEILALTFLPDFLDPDMTQRRAILPCSHVMGSETMRSYCEDLIDNGNTIFACPYPQLPILFPFLPSRCPSVWEYRHVRHVACFTTTEMHNTEKTIAINFVGKDSITLTCPGCFTWCSKSDPKQTRIRCFLCTKEIGEEFLFCGYCLRVWKNARSGRCANPMCKSIEATLDILRNSPKMDLYGGDWPTIRLCPRCGILTEFKGGCSQMHCELCGYYYCFLCLKGARNKGQLKCIPYDSLCQRASLQTSIPEWDGRNRGEMVEW